MFAVGETFISGVARGRQVGGGAQTFFKKSEKQKKKKQNKTKQNKKGHSCVKAQERGRKSIVDWGGL